MVLAHYSVSPLFQRSTILKARVKDRAMASRVRVMVSRSRVSRVRFSGALVLRTFGIVDLQYSGRKSQEQSLCSHHNIPLVHD